MTAFARDAGGTGAAQDGPSMSGAHALKALAQYLNDRRDPLYELSYETGATKADSMIDIDGGIATLFVVLVQGPARDAG